MSAFWLLLLTVILLGLLVGWLLYMYSENSTLERKLKTAEQDVKSYRKVAVRLQEKADAKYMELYGTALGWAKYSRQLEAKLKNQQPASQFNDEQLKTLINLCHPDRHGGKQSAVEITQVLLSMRKVTK